MPLAGFDTVILLSERPQTDDLNSGATEIGCQHCALCALNRRCIRQQYNYEPTTLTNKWVNGPTHGTTRVTTHTCYSIAATTPELTIEILNSVF